MDDYESTILGAQLQREQWDRFRNLSGDGPRETIDESERLRNEFIRHTQIMLTSDEDGERCRSARWVHDHAEEVAHRSAIMRAMYRRFLTVDCGPVVFPVDG